MVAQKRARVGIWLTILVLALLSTSTSLAAPPSQDEPPTPTGTLTETPAYYGPTYTPTPTLLPPPPGGGRVAVRVLVVRYGPDTSWFAVGGLDYGEEVYPVGRSVNGAWIAIDWEDGIGWVLARLLKWHPEVKLDELPVILPPMTATSPASQPPTATITAVSTSTAEPEPPTASPTAAPTETPLPVPSPTTAPSETPPPATDTPQPPAVAEEPAAAETEPESPPPDAAPGPVTSLPLWPAAGWIGGGLAALIIGVYGWQRIARSREIKRYANGFILDICPVCQEGQLELEEHLRGPFSLRHIHRSVRCNVCRSVLRSVQPGKWRYTIDPFVNPRLAEDFNGEEFDDSGLIDFLHKAVTYPPYEGQEAFAAPAIDPDQSAMEIVSELEARYLEEKAAQEAEEAARQAQSEEQEEAGAADSASSTGEEDSKE